MKIDYPKNYWRDKYEKKTKIGKYIHAIRFMYKGGGIKSVIMWHWVALKLLLEIHKKQ